MSTIDTARKLILIILAAVTLFDALPAFADGPVLDDIYPQQRPDGTSYSIGRWSNGTETVAESEYPEMHACGALAYVWRWDNGTYSVALRQYPERRADGSIWFVWQWEDGTYTTKPMPSASLVTSAPKATAAPVAADALFAWGTDRYGELGDGQCVSRAPPTTVPGLGSVRALAAGLEFSLALQSDGTVWAWG